MSGKFTESDVAGKFKALRPTTEIVTRGAYTSPDDLVHSVKALIHKTVNADIDSAYCLMALFAKEQALSCDVLLDRVLLLTRIGPELHLDDVAPDATHVGDLLVILDEMEGASADKLDHLAGQFTTKVKSFAESSKTGTGIIAVGPDSAQLLGKATAAIDEIQKIAELLLSNSLNFETAVSTFGQADLSSSTRVQQIAKAKKTLTGYMSMPTTSGNVSEAILDSALLSSMLSNSTDHKDITKPKFEGPVTIVPDKSAVLFGMTSPFILQTGEIATLQVNTGSQEVTGDLSAHPSSKAVMSIKPDLYEFSESGEIASGDGTAQFFTSSLTAVGNANPVQHPEYANQEVNANKWLKTYVKPGTVHVETLFVDPTDPDLLVPFSITYNTAGNVSVTPQTTLPPLTSVTAPAEAVPAPDHVYTFPDPLYTSAFSPDYAVSIVSGQAPVGRVEILDAANNVIATLVEDVFGLAGNLYAEVAPPGQFGPYGSVDYGAASISLDLSGHPEAANFVAGTQFNFVEGTWELAFNGTINHQTGRASFVFPSPVAEGAAVNVSYTCYPIGLMEDRQMGTLLGMYDQFSVFDTNTLVTTTVLPSGISQNTPIHDGVSLAGCLDQSFLTALFSVASVPLDPPTVRLYGPTAGTASRITFPNYGPARLKVSPFGPTWLNRPTHINQAIGALHHLSGDTFGGHSYVKDITKNPPLDAEGLLELGILVKSIATGAAATSSNSSGLPETDFRIPKDIQVRAGDKAEVFSPGVFYVDIALVLPNVDPGATTQTIRLAQPIPRALTNTDFGGTSSIAAAEALDDPPTLKLNITSNKLRITGSNASGSKLTVTAPGFGLTGAMDAESSAFYLGAQFPLTKTPTDAGYIIKPNDIVFQGDERIARIVGVSGNSTNPDEAVSVSFAPLPSANISFPITSLKIVAQGHSKFLEALPALTEVRQDLSVLVSNGELPSKAKAFFGSGAGYSQYGELLYSLQTVVQNLRNIYAGYDAHIVKSVGGLLDYLKSEKLTAIHNILTGLQFSGLSAINPATLSQEVSMEVLLEDALRMFGGSADFVGVSSVETTPLSDYHNRGIDSLEDIAEIPTGG